MSELNKIRILIADDNIDICNALRDHFSSLSDMDVVAIASNGKQAYDLFIDQKPDIVLLDLIMPVLDGFGFLELLEDLDDHHAKIVVISAISDEKLINYALAKGADYYIMKPCDYSIIEKRIRSITKSRSASYSKIITTKQVEKKTSTKKQQELDLSSTLARLLIDSGIPVHTLGYKYFHNAILYLFENKSDVFSITKSIYPHVASQYDTSPSCVDKAMRHSVNLAFNKNSEQFHHFLRHMYARDSITKPSNSEFINLVLEKIKQTLSTN